MLINSQTRQSLEVIFEAIRLKSSKTGNGSGKVCKIEQIFSYLEIIHANLRKYSPKRKLVLVDSGAGNCYLSFLVYYFYTQLEPRNITLHCVDHNEKLMNRCQQRAAELGFKEMHFHSCDILDLEIEGTVDLVYCLHACNSATDKTLYFGSDKKAATILSVSCCQHDIKQKIRNQRYSSITKHSVYKDRIAYMVGDSLRALLLEMQGYKTDIFEFVSSRYTDKNTMLRARRCPRNNRDKTLQEYQKIKDEFKVSPELESYLLKDAS